ncbi:MAG: hypothetical protein GY797_01545 [Deltaproteobacteria bacterium]|nr:hypothetical protein [Deltaproteobacteria bacterium]
MEPIYNIVKEISTGQVQDVWSLIASGHYTNLFFDKWTPFVGMAIKNNISLLLLIAVTWVKISKLTKNKWDDRASNWLFGKLTGFKKPKEKEGRAT